MKENTLLWLDDARDPFNDYTSWVYMWSPIPKPYAIVWVKSYNEFVQWITENGLPTAIMFDHDLADEHYVLLNLEQTLRSYDSFVEKTGYHCAKWLIDYCMDNKLKLPKYFAHTANEVGRENINKLLENYKKHCE